MAKFRTGAKSIESAKKWQVALEATEKDSHASSIPTYTDLPFRHYFFLNMHFLYNTTHFRRGNMSLYIDAPLDVEQTAVSLQRNNNIYLWNHFLSSK